MADIVKTNVVADSSDSVEYVKLPTAVALTPGTDQTVTNFFETKDNSCYLYVKCTTAGNLVLKAGTDFKSNAILGDLTIALVAGEYAILVDRAGRFEEGCDLVISEDTTAVGTAQCFGKKAGI